MNWSLVVVLVLVSLVVLYFADKGHPWAKAAVRVVIFLTVIRAAIEWLAQGIRGDWLTDDGLVLFMYAWLGLIKVGGVQPLIPWLAARRARRNREQARDSRG